MAESSINGRGQAATNGLRHRARVDSARASRACASTVAKVAAAPAHAELAAALRQWIRAGNYRHRERIPTEAELAGQFDISVRSVRLGIDELVAEGLLQRRQGSGTYVCNGHPRQTNGRMQPAYAMVLPLAIRGYHPFFSEMLRGIREGIGQLGHDVHELNFAGKLSGRVDIGAVPWSEEETLRDLAACEGLAGVICGASIARRLRADLTPEMPLVTVDPSDDVPYVAYDWDAELDQAVKGLIQGGARHIWAYGGGDAWRPTLVPTGVRVTHVGGASKDANLLSTHIRHAFEAAEQAFGDDPLIDGVAVMSDFESQGVLDAAVKCGLKVPEKVKFTCLVNRESRLVYPFPLTVQIADGYLKGRRVVELLHQHATSACVRPQRVVLRCEEAVYADA